MGWGGGTDIFDKMVEKVLYGSQCKHIAKHQKVELLSCLIDGLEQQDWNCQADSAYLDSEIVQLALIQSGHKEWVEGMRGEKAVKDLQEEVKRVRSQGK